MLLSCGVMPDGGVIDEIVLVCCSNWDSICATGTKSGHVYLWQISGIKNRSTENFPEEEMIPFCILVPNSMLPTKLIGMVFVLSPSPLLQSCTDELLLTLHSDNILRYWSLDNGRCIAQLTNAADYEILQLVSLADKRFVLLVGHQRITIIDTWSRLNCGVLKIASCPSKKKTNNLLYEDSPEINKMQSPSTIQFLLNQKAESQSLSNIYGEYGESMIFNVSTNHDYFDLLHWSSNISLFDYCEENKYPTAHFYTVAAMLNTGQILVWDLSALIRIWWHFIPIPHCEIPCPVPKPQKSNVPKPFMKYSQDISSSNTAAKNLSHYSSAISSQDQILIEKNKNSIEGKYSQTKIDNSNEEIIGSYENCDFVLEHPNNVNINSKSGSYELPNIYQIQSHKSPMLAPTFFSLHPCFVSQPINLYSIPSNEMFSTQIIITDLYLIVNAKYRLIIWKRTFLSQFQNRGQRYQPFGDLFVPTTPIIEELKTNLFANSEQNVKFYQNLSTEKSKSSTYKQGFSKLSELNFTNNQDDNFKQKLHIWLGFSQISIKIKPSSCSKIKFCSLTKAINTFQDDEHYVSFLAWSSDFTIYNIKIPSIVSFLFRQDFNLQFESNISLSIHELSEIDNHVSYNDISATPIFILKNYYEFDKDQLNYMNYFSSCWQFFKINTFYDQNDNIKTGGSPSCNNSQLNSLDHIIWIHRNNFKIFCDKYENLYSNYDNCHDRIFYTFLNFRSENEDCKIPFIYEFPIVPSFFSCTEISGNYKNNFVNNDADSYDFINTLHSTELDINSLNSYKNVEINFDLSKENYLFHKKNKCFYWKSTYSLKKVWENNLTDFNKKCDISVLACDLTEQKNSIYCIISLSNGKVMGQCLTKEFGLFNFINCNEEKHFFGNIENGVVYQLPIPKFSCDHTISVNEIKSVADGCIFGITCCGCILVWKVNLTENATQSSVLDSNNGNFSHQNLRTNTSKSTQVSNNKTQATSNNLFSLLTCIDGLFFTNILSLSKVIIFDVTRLGELATPKYDKFQILIHSSQEKKCLLIKISGQEENMKDEFKEFRSENMRPLRHIWDERRILNYTEHQNISYEALNLSLNMEFEHEIEVSRITSVAIDKPSNYVFILRNDLIFVFDKDSCLLLTKIRLNAILELKDYEYQNYHLSYGLISSLHRFVLTCNRLEFLDHGIMYGTLYLGLIPKRSTSKNCLNVNSGMNLSYLIFNPHVSTDIISIEKQRQRTTRTSRYLQHLFPLFIRSTDEFLSKLFANMAPLSVRPILRFNSLIIGENYSISIPIYKNINRQITQMKNNSRSKLWDSVGSYLNIWKIQNSESNRRCESLDSFKNIYYNSKESKIRSYTFDGVGFPPYRYVVSENWSEHLIRHLDTKTMSIKILRTKLMISNKSMIKYPGKPFSEWNQHLNKKKYLGVDTNDYYIGELSGIPCTSHLVNRIVRSRHSISNKKGLKHLNSSTSNNSAIIYRTLNRGETFNTKDYTKSSNSSNKDNDVSSDFPDIPRPLFRSRTYESTNIFNNNTHINDIEEQLICKLQDPDKIWLARFLNERNSSSNYYYVETDDSCNIYNFSDKISENMKFQSFKQVESNNYEHFSAHHLALQMVILHYYFTYYSNVDLPIQLLDKFLLSWIINHLKQDRLIMRFIPFHLFSITSMTLDIFNPYIRSSAKYCLQLAIRSLPSELLAYCEEIAIDTLSGILREFNTISSSNSNKSSQGDQLLLLEKEVMNSTQESCTSTGSINDEIQSIEVIKSIPPWNESCKRGHPKNYSYCCISLCRMIGYRLPFPIMNSGEYYHSNLSIEDLSLFFLSIVLYEHPFKRTHSECIGKIILAFLISIITSYDIEVIIKFSKNFERQLEKKRLIKPIYCRRHQNEQWYSWENVHMDISNSSIFLNSCNLKNRNNLNYDVNSYYNVVSIMDTLRFLFAMDLFSLNFTSLLKSKYIEDTCIPELLKTSLTNWENNIYMATTFFQIEKNMISDEMVILKNNSKIHLKVSSSIICLCIRLLTLAQYPPFWTSCRHLLQLIGQLDPLTYIYILGYAGRTSYTFMGINYTCNVLSLLVYFVSSYPEYSFPHLNMVLDITIGFLDPLDSTLRKGTITAVTSVLFILVSVFPMITFHQNTQRLAIGYEKSIIVYDLRTATKWRVLQGHKGTVDALCFNKEGEYLASYSIMERALRIWQCTQSGLLGGLLGISGNCIKIIELSEIPPNPLNCSLYYRLKVVKILCRNTREWQLKRENKKTYTISIERN